MKLDAFRGIPNPYYAVQFTEEQLGEILSYRTGQYDPAIEKVDKRSAELADGFAKSEDPQERIAVIGHMADVEKQRKTVQDEFHEFIERMLKPDQFSAVRPRMLAGTSSVRVKIDMQDWPPLKAIKTIAENGGVKLEIEPSARKVLETKGKTVNIRSSPVTPAVAIERVAGALGVRISRRGDTLVLYLPQDGVSVVPSPGYGQGSVEVTPGTQMRLVRWRFGVRDILPRYNLQRLTKYLKSVSPKAEIELDKVTNTILVIMPERNVAAVKEAMNALRE